MPDYTDKPPQYLHDLSEEELKRLEKVPLTGIEAVGDTWKDDHELCTAVELKWQDGTEYTISIWCISPEGYAALVYANDCERAWKEAFSTVRCELPDEYEMIGKHDA